MYETLRRVWGAGVLCSSIVVLFACGDGSETNAVGAVCGLADAPSECGEPCGGETGSSCAGGFYCSDQSSTCAADCNTEVSCETGFACTASGRCVENGALDLGDRSLNEVCDAPDVLVTLDVSGSLSEGLDRSPLEDSPSSRRNSKWGNAVASITDFTSAFGNTMRFGLASFPSNHSEGMTPREGCHILPEWEGYDQDDDFSGPGGPLNNACDFPAEITVPVGEDTAEDIARYVTQDTTPLCWWTPLARAVFLAGTELGEIAEEGREQFVVLITDGKQTFPGPPQGCFRFPGVPFIEAQELARNNIRTFVIGFEGSSGSIDPNELNDLACAGRMVSNLDEACEKDSDGNYRAPINPPEDLFLKAGSEAELRQQLQKIAGEVGCCDCDGISILE